MGKHGDPDRHDTNPLHGIFRTFEPAHTGFERDPDRVETFPPIADDETEIISYGRSDAYPEWNSDPEPYPDEPDPEQADEEIARNRAPALWPWAMALSAGLCAVGLMAWQPWANASPTAVSDPHSPQATVFVTVSPESVVKVKSRPGPTVTKTVQPMPAVVTAYAPAPRVTITKRPDPIVSVKISRVPVPGPTVTVRCMVVITVNRLGSELNRQISGPC